MLEWSLQSPNGEAGVGAVDQDLEGRGIEVRGGEGGGGRGEGGGGD